MAREAVPSYTFVLCVVRQGERYLLVHERDGTWFLPSGGVEPGESLVEAAHRETLEEAGVPIEPEGLVGWDHAWLPDRRGGLVVKWRFALRCLPEGDTQPRSEPNEHTRGAAWFTVEQIAELPLRSPEVLEWVTLVHGGAPLLPMQAYSAYPAR